MSCCMTGRFRPDPARHSGPILTLASTKGEPDTDEAGYVLNDNGKRAHIVHQYDRKPDLFKMIRQRYA